MQSTFDEALKYNEGLRPHLSKVSDDLNPLRAQVNVCVCLHASSAVLAIALICLATAAPTPAAADACVGIVGVKMAAGL